MCITRDTGTAPHAQPSVRSSGSRGAKAPHVRSRSEINGAYQKQRAPVPDERVPWSVAWPAYAPIEFTHESVAKQPVWADPVDASRIAGLRDRLSYESSPLTLAPNGRPLNPFGRTGTTGRGLLGKWGPNHAADPIVLRARPDGVFEMVAIKRRDTGQWAIPGGMVDAGEVVSVTLRREFTEEAGALDDPREQAALSSALDVLFGSGGSSVYCGYVDDPRNTDNAWMETAVHAFLLPADLSAKLPLQSGSDAADVRWLPLDEQLLGGDASALYADHLRFVMLALRQVGGERVRSPSAENART